MKVAVVGGGMAGLAAAHGLLEQGAEPALFEAAARAGGKVGSLGEQGFLTEDGPNALAPSAARLRVLARELGLQAEVREARRGARWVWRGGALHKAPSPGLFSAAGWLRALAEPLAPGPRLETDRPLRGYLIERLGQEAGALAAEVMANGVYAGDPARLSARDAFPALGKLGSRKRSLLLAALSREGGPPGERASKGLWSFESGLGRLTGALAARLGDRLKVGRRVTELTPAGEGFRVDGESFDAAVLALPAHAATELVASFAPALAAGLAAIHYAPIAVVHLGVAAKALRRPAKGFGLLDADRALSVLGTLFPSWLFPGRAPEGHVLLTSLVGGARRPELVSLSDGELVALVQGDLARALGLVEPPAYVRVVRHARAIPQYEVGHGERVRAIEAAAAPWPRLAFCGAAHHGVALDACARSGLAAARKVLAAPGNPAGGR